MINSMTGYGMAKCTLENKNIVVETKSVNHRNLEIVVRIPNMLAALEPEIKKKIGEQLFRGRIEVNIRTESDLAKGSEEKLEINLPLLHNYYSLLKEIKRELNFDEEITLRMITGFRDVFYYPESDINLEEIWSCLEKTLTDALDALTAMRHKEGEILYGDFIMRLDLIANYIIDLKSRVPQVVKEYKERLFERIHELVNDIEIDESRLSQEVAIMAEKSDITEEIVRLESHLSQFREMLEVDGAVGRKMDFILQEMHREINTIGSKSSDVSISRNVIEIKSELAKMREQIQNVE